MEKKDIALSVCIALTAPNIASAESFSGIAELNLGDIKSSSFLDEPFRGSIPILYTSVEESSQLRVGLASNAIFKEFDIEDQAVLSKLKFKIKIRNNRPYVDIRSSQAIDLPFLSFVVEIFSPEGSIYQDYTVLLDPRNYAAVAKANTSNKATKAKRNLSSKIVNQRPTRVKVSSGDTLSGIANTVKLSGVSNKSMSQAIFLSNPRAFSGNNVNKLKKGFTLKIPTLDAVKEIQKTGKRIEDKKISTETLAVSKIKVEVIKDSVKSKVKDSQAQNYLVKGGDTLSGIARKFASPSKSFSEVMKAIHSENPHAFSNNQVNRLKKGVNLTIPRFDSSEALNESTSNKKSENKVESKNNKSVKSSPSITETEFTIDRYKVKNGDTLGSIVEKLQYKKVSSSKVMEAIFTANPEAFEKDNITVIKAGTAIRIPSEAELNTIKIAATPQVTEVAKTPTVAKNSVEQTINHSLDSLEKRLREIRTELKTTQASLFDLNLTLQNKDILIKRQAKDISILKKKLAKVEVTNQTTASLPEEINEVNFSTLADLITNDIKREKTLATNITYSGIALLLGLIGLRIARQRYADRIVGSENYVPIANFEPQVFNENIDFKKTLTEAEDTNTDINQTSVEESERLVDELVDELNHSVEEMQDKKYGKESIASFDIINPSEAADQDEELTEQVTDIEKTETTDQAKIEPDFELIQAPFITTSTTEHAEELESATDLKAELLSVLEEDTYEENNSKLLDVAKQSEEPATASPEDDNEMNFELIQSSLPTEHATEEEEKSAINLKAELLNDLGDITEPTLVYTNRAQYQSHYGFESTEIDLEKRLQSINDEISIKKLEDKV